MLQQIFCVVYNFWISIMNPYCQHNIPQTGLKPLQSYCTENRRGEHSPVRAECAPGLRNLCPLPRGRLPVPEDSSGMGQHVMWDQAAGNRVFGERCETPLLGVTSLPGSCMEAEVLTLSSGKEHAPCCAHANTLVPADLDRNPQPLTWLSSGLTSDLLHCYGFVWWLLGGDWTLLNITRSTMLSGTVGLCWWVHCPVNLAAALSSWLSFPWGTVHSSSSLTNSTCKMYSKWTSC